MSPLSILDQEYEAGFYAGTNWAARELANVALALRSAASGGDGTEPHWFAADRLDEIEKRARTIAPPPRK